MAVGYAAHILNLLFLGRLSRRIILEFYLIWALKRRFKLMYNIRIYLFNLELALILISK